MSVDMNKTYEIQGQQFTVANLQQIDFGQIQSVEPGAPRWPVGVYEWEVISSEIDEIYGVLGIRNKLKCSKVIAFEDPAEKPEEWIGKEREENRRLRLQDGVQPTQADIMYMFGTQKDFMEKTGYQVVGQIQQALAGWTGTRFNAAIAESPNRKDPSKPYRNMNIYEIVPVAQVQPQISGNTVTQTFQTTTPQVQTG